MHITSNYLQQDFNVSDLEKPRISLFLQFWITKSFHNFTPKWILSAKNTRTSSTCNTSIYDFLTTIFNHLKQIPYWINTIGSHIKYYTSSNSLAAWIEEFSSALQKHESKLDRTLQPLYTCIDIYIYVSLWEGKKKTSKLISK